jgi:hypothetical protein
MFGDVGDPEPVWFMSFELPVDEITGGRGLVDRAAAMRPWKPFQPSALHQHLDRALPDRDLVREGELGVHAACAIGPARRRVDLADHVGQPHVAECPRRRRSFPPREIARLGHI